jgi:predicted dehydrogenase
VIIQGHKMVKTVTALLFGAGDRGMNSYGPYAINHPQEIQFIGVAEPNENRRLRFAQAHGIPKELCFDSWESVIAQGKIADVVINCTQDRMHFDSGMAALQAGYDMLLEKPICSTLRESIALVETAEREGRRLFVCHVLRYTDFFSCIHQIVQSGKLGEIITISHRENVSSWHMAHSYVRGNWRKTPEAPPMILAKSCHDLDLLYWFIGKPVKQLSSFGSLTHFRSENAPEGAPKFCLDGCPIEDTCPFYAPSIYIDLYPLKYGLSQSTNLFYRSVGIFSLRSPRFLNLLSKLIPFLKNLTEYSGWPRSVISDHPQDRDAILQALREGPYGRCVYHCDNDVVDHQVVSMEFEGGITGSFTMHGHSHEEGRTTRIDGTQASLLAKFGFNTSFIEVHNHRSMQVERIDFPNNVESDEHGGGDFGIVRDFIRTVQGRGEPMTPARESLESHIMAFAAEESRESGTVIEMVDFRKAKGI